MAGGPVRLVLVVDDDPDVLELFGRMLLACDAGLEVVAASSGRGALGELRRETPDLMLLDIVMPDLDGWHVLASMVEDGTIDTVPTFLVSAQDPADQPPVSHFFLAAIDRGLSLSELLACSLDVSARILRPEGELDPAPG